MIVRRICVVALATILYTGQAMSAAIHDAAKKGDVAGIEKVLDSGVDVDASDGRATPLYYAVTKGRVTAVRLLISKGADVNRGTAWGPPIINAAWNCDTEILALLLEKGAEPNAAFETETALHMAAQRGHLDCVKLLVEAGADVNALNKFREPPIHSAKRKGAENVVQYLYHHGYVVPQPPPIAKRLAAASAEAGEIVFNKECRNCHDPGPEQRLFRGPPLWNILGRDIASVANFPYSEVLRQQSGHWDYEKLNVFLSDPARTLPGTDMGSNGVQDEGKRADLIMFLRGRGDRLHPLP